MKFVIGAIFSVLLITSALAQSDKRAEFFVGYSNLQAEGFTDRNNSGSSVGNVLDSNFFRRREGLNGVEAAVTGFPGKVFGITGDFAFHGKSEKDSLTTGQTNTDTRIFSFLAGPTLKFRNSGRIEPFAHVLAGGAHTRYDVKSNFTINNTTFTNSYNVNGTDFSMAVGGGVDVRLGDKFSLRAIQVDYNPIFYRDRTFNALSQAGAIQPFTLDGQRQDNIRISVGLVF